MRVKWRKSGKATGRILSAESRATLSSKPFTLSVKVVILDQAGRCLLLKRFSHSTGNPGKWDFPGGKADLGERFDEALLREVQEETGLNISLQQVVGATESELPARKVAYLIMEGRLVSGATRLSHEHTVFVWVPVNQLLEMDLVEQFVEFAKAYSLAKG